VVNCPKIYSLQITASGNIYSKYKTRLEERRIAFLSKTLNKTQLKWSTFKKEAYAIYHSLMKWERDVHFTLQTDHKKLTYLNAEIKQKVQR
jgi:hypothetical protein